ncbi:cholecystokinin receptor type A [Hemiscyllium ocellatum]|uniref:cholecystokinin receptor type A n=1 Tax=Hemiscyllium ocellatum TaxID=170820 RepID=UPI002966298B|nr:cholecystokinin receptor type A [Hemiscyllium ocellatum]
METVPDLLVNLTVLANPLGIADTKRETESCRNESCEQFPRPPRDLNQTVRIFLYCLFFLLSVLGNVLIITVLLRNKRLRTVTNSFLLSLATSDLMLCLFCMPFTLIPNLLKDFIFGSAVCKAVSYFMGISVSVSTFSLVAISLERYSAICKPLKSRVWQTKSHAFKVIAATWLLSVIIMLPYPIYNTLVPFTRVNNSTGNMCRLLWPNAMTQQSWYIFLLLILFLVPGIVMTVAYGLISRELYSGIRFEMNRRKRSQVRNLSDSRYEDGDGCYIQSIKQKRTIEMQRLSGSDCLKPVRPRTNSSSANLVAKKRVIRMLIVIVIMFFICWTPIFCVNAWRAFDKISADRLLSGAPISFIHLLSYTSACVNPIIYCFMNKRFRLAALATCCCCCCCFRANPPPANRETEEDRHTTTGTVSRWTYTSVSVS